jgi:protein phosphatase
VASSLSVTSIEGFVLDLLRRFTNLQATDEAMVLSDFQMALQQTEARIFEEATHHPEYAGMGTTLTLALVSGWLLFVIHAGDSRCYLLRAGKLQQLTEDHTWVGEMTRLGKIKPEAARTHDFRHVITNCLGGDESGVRVEVQKMVLQPGDTILLCSDGLTNMVDDERIAKILASYPEPRLACEQLVTEAKDRGGRDNITVIVSRFETT